MVTELDIDFEVNCTFQQAPQPLNSTLHMRHAIVAICYVDIAKKSIKFIN